MDVSLRVEPFGITLEDHATSKFLSLNKRATIDILRKTKTALDKNLADKIRSELNEKELLTAWSKDYGSAIFSAPEIVNFEVTLACPLKCNHCYSNSGYSKENELSDSEVFRILSEIKSLNVYTVNWTGGEPFARKNFFKFCEYVDTFAHQDILSNGYLITEKIAKELTGLINLSGVQISIDGGTAKTHDKIRGNGSWERAVNAIKLLKEHEIPVGINSVISKDNKDCLSDLVQLAIDLQPDYFRMVPVVKVGRAIDQEIAEIDRYNMQEKIFNFSKKYGDKVFITNLDDSAAFLFDNRPLEHPGYKLHKDKIKSCQGGVTSIHISSEGDVLPCGYFTKENSAGSLREKSLENIWLHSDIFTEMRNITVLDSEECNNCEDFCRGCRAEAYLEYGKLDAPDPFCKKIAS